MKHITYNGKDMTLAMNMQAAINYERMTGKNAFAILGTFESTPIQSSLGIGYAMLLANNDPHDIPDFEEFLKNEDSEFTGNLIQAAIAEVLEYFKITPAEAEQQKANGAAEEPKND